MVTYNSSRMADGYLYLFSEYYTGGDMVKDKPVTYVPLVNGKRDEPDQYLSAAGELWNNV